MDTPERLHFHFSLSCIGEGNGNPLQCSCLENPRGAWWAAIYGVAQSQTRLKRLSSSSSRTLTGPSQVVLVVKNLPANAADAGSIPRSGISPGGGKWQPTLLLLLSCFSPVRFCATPETAAHQAPPSLGFSRQEHWSGLPFPSPGDLPDPGIESMSLRSPALAGWVLYH